MTETKRQTRYRPKNASLKSSLGMTMIPTCPSLTPCSPPSRTLRAAYGGGLRPSWTAAALGASGKLGRDKETASFSRTKKRHWVRSPPDIARLNERTLHSYRNSIGLKLREHFGEATPGTFGSICA